MGDITPDHGIAVKVDLGQRTVGWNGVQFTIDMEIPQLGSDLQSEIKNLPANEILYVYHLPGGGLGSACDMPHDGIRYTPFTTCTLVDGKPEIAVPGYIYVLDLDGNLIQIQDII